MLETRRRTERCSSGFSLSHTHTRDHTMSARTRRQKAQQAKVEDEHSDSNLNGNSNKVAEKANGSTEKRGARRKRTPSRDEEQRENIFLFWPNIIGMRRTGRLTPAIEGDE